jgi:hypothetical protein
MTTAVKPNFATMTKEEKAIWMENFKAEKAAQQPVKMTDKQWAKREAKENAPKTNIYGDMDIAEINRFNARKNMPSSLR